MLIKKHAYGGLPRCKIYAYSGKSLCPSTPNSLFLRALLANSADTDEMPSYVAFNLGLTLHCLSKYLFTSIKNEGQLILSL